MPRSNTPLSPVPSGTLTAAVVFLVLAVLAVRPSSGRAEDLISGIGLTHLEVYGQRPAPDGLMSGSPHVHAVTDEGYYVLSGSGRVELHDLKDGFRSVDLLPGRYLQFPPGVLHRLVSTNHLVLLVVMGNAGLAEQGDARIYFGRAVDDDPAEYARLVGLAKAKGLEGARAQGRRHPGLCRPARSLGEGPQGLLSRARALRRRPPESRGGASRGLLEGRRIGPRGLGRALPQAARGPPVDP
jgi:mannose-6-phosphate isomerase-like protein (cupin superfamily)